MDFLSTIGIGTTVAALITSIIYFVTAKIMRQQEQENLTVEDKITTLTKNLKNSVEIISEIETEIENRSEIVTKLKNDAERYEKLKLVNEEQVEAIAQTLRGEIKSESKKSIWRNAIINFVVALSFFVLGYFLRGGI